MARDITTRNIRNEADRFFDGLFPGTRMPSVDIREDKDGYTLAAEVAGWDAKDISVYVEDNVLHIKGEAAQADEQGRKYIVRERCSCSFERSFTLPDDVDAASMKASFRNGVLTLTMPRRAKEEPRRIEVSIG